MEMYRDDRGKISMNQLHKHPMNMLRIYERLIEEALDNYALISVILTEVAQIHRRYFVSKDQIAVCIRCAY